MSADEKELKEFKLRYASTINAYRTVMQMLNDRGYDTELDEFKEIKVKDLRDKLIRNKDGKSDDKADNLTCRYDLKQLELESDDAYRKRNRPLLVYWACDHEKVNTDTITNLELLSNQTGCKRVILLIREDQKLAKGADKSDGLNIEKFTVEDLQVNITKHSMVPPHFVLTAKEKDELLKKYLIRDDQLPKIRKDDPIARYFGVLKGEVMKIKRKSQTAGRYITYRIVI